MQERAKTNQAIKDQLPDGYWIDDKVKTAVELHCEFYNEDGGNVLGLFHSAEEALEFALEWDKEMYG